MRLLARHEIGELRLLGKSNFAKSEAHRRGKLTCGLHSGLDNTDVKAAYCYIFFSPARSQRHQHSAFY